MCLECAFVSAFCFETSCIIILFCVYACVCVCVCVCVCEVIDLFSSLVRAGADLINSQRTHGARQTLQAKTILKVLQMRDSLRAVRDRVVTAHAGVSATAQSGSQSLYQSFFDPSFLLRAPSAAALFASHLKQVC